MLASLATDLVVRASHQEYAEAVALREKESYVAADAIVTVTDEDRCAVKSLAPPAVPVLFAPLHTKGARAVVVSSASAQALAQALSEALTSAHTRLVVPTFSTRAIEERLPGLRTMLPSNERKTERFRATFLLGQELTTHGRAADGLVQLRHALTAVRFGADAGREIGSVYDTLAHAYRLLGDREGVIRSRVTAETLRASFLRLDSKMPVTSTNMTS